MGRDDAILIVRLNKVTPREFMPQEFIQNNHVYIVIWIQQVERFEVPGYCEWFLSTETQDYIPSCDPRMTFPSRSRKGRWSWYADKQTAIMHAIFMNNNVPPYKTRYGIFLLETDLSLSHLDTRLGNTTVYFKTRLDTSPYQTSRYTEDRLALCHVSAKLALIYT